MIPKLPWVVTSHRICHSLMFPVLPFQLPHYDPVLAAPAWRSAKLCHNPGEDWVLHSGIGVHSPWKRGVERDLLEELSRQVRIGDKGGSTALLQSAVQGDCCQPGTSGWDIHLIRRLILLVFCCWKARGLHRSTQAYTALQRAHLQLCFCL